MRLLADSDQAEIRLENNGHVIATIEPGCDICGKVRILWPRPGLCSNVYTVSIEQLVTFLARLGVDPAQIDLMIG